MFYVSAMLCHFFPQSLLPCHQLHVLHLYSLSSAALTHLSPSSVFSLPVGSCSLSDPHRHSCLATVIHAVSGLFLLPFSCQVFVSFNPSFFHSLSLVFGIPAQPRFLFGSLNKSSFFSLSYLPLSDKSINCWLESFG